MAGGEPGSFGERGELGHVAGAIRGEPSQARAVVGLGCGSVQGAG